MNARSMRRSAAKSRVSVLCAAISVVLCTDALCADVSVTPPTGGSFVVRDSSGNPVHFQVDASGNVLIPGLQGAPARNTLICFDTVSGTLGPCAAGDSTHRNCSMTSSSGTYNAGDGYVIQEVGSMSFATGVNGGIAINTYCR